MKQSSFLAVAIMLIAIATSHAQVDPPGLNPGDQFRYVFVTSTERDALSTSIADYNAFVNAAASNNANLAGINFNVIGSTETVDAIDNTGTNAAGDDVPIYMLDGTLVATGNADLWDGDLITGINLDENLNTVTGRVWTGSFTDGTDINDFELGSGNLARYGSSGDQFGSWVFEAVGASGLSENFYGLSDTLTVAVPEPATASLLLLSSVGLIGFRRRRNV